MKKLLFIMQTGLFIAAFPLLAYMELNHDTTVTEAVQTVAGSSIAKQHTVMTGSNKPIRKKAVARRSEAVKILITSDVAVKCPLPGAEAQENEAAANNGSNLPIVMLSAEEPMYRAVNYTYGKAEEEMKMLEKCLQLCEAMMKKECREKLMNLKKGMDDKMNNRSHSL